MQHRGVCVRWVNEVVSIQIGFYVHGKVLKLWNKNGKTKVTRNVGHKEVENKVHRKIKKKIEN